MLRYRSSSLSKDDSRSQILCSPEKDETLAASPSTVMILHKIKLLFESNKFDECALMIKRLSSSVVESILSELPVVDFIDAIPQSFVILDALCSKASLLGPNSSLATHLRPKLLVTYVVRWVSGLKDGAETNGAPQKSFDHYRSVLKRLFTVLTLIHPNLKDELITRRTTLEKCQQGLGQHGPVSSPLDSTKMTTIHDALKNACIQTIQSMKTVLHKLDDIGPSHANRIRVPLQRDSAPVTASHQRQVQVTLKEVENRLILNKTLLDAVDASATSVCGSFDEMLGSLRRRIDSDKEVLFSLTELRREIPGRSVSVGCPVMPQIQQLVQGYVVVIELLEEVAPEMMSDLEDDSESERDDAQMKRNGGKTVNQNTLTGKTSGNSEEEQSVFLPNSPLTSNVRQMEKGVTSDARGKSVDQQKQEVERLKKELVLAKKQLATSQEKILQFQEREKSLVERLSTQAQTQLEKSTTKFEDINLGVNRPTQLIRRYGNLYAESRVDVLDALDELTELDDMDDLKTKLLFSIVILAFRSAERSLKDFRSQLTKLLDTFGEFKSQAERNSMDPTIRDIESTLMLHLRKTADRKNLNENVKEVSAQVWQTLYDYPSLKKCQGLLNFISETVQLAWALTIQNPGYVLEFESRRFSTDRHTHFHTSNSDSDVIRTYVWPGLREGDDGPVVYRGVVIT